jgi:uncharacterized membrane protein
MKPRQLGLLAIAILGLPALRYALLWSGLPLVASYMTLSAAFIQGVIWSSMAVWFGASLRQGEVPLITRIATLTRGRLSPELITYTRRVTLVWCGFCLCMVLVPLLLLAAGAHNAWTFFVSFLTLPLLAAMAAAEYAYRRIRYRHLRHESPADMVRLVRQFRGLIRR